MKNIFIGLGLIAISYLFALLSTKGVGPDVWYVLNSLVIGVSGLGFLIHSLIQYSK